MIATTQDHLPIQDIRDDVAILKDGSLAIIIQTSAVNFGLLSENEQLAIISAFAGMINSLSFMIQIIIRSKRLDISSYLKQLDQAQARQRNPLLSSMIGRYRTFIRNTIQENQVLDKQFYIAIPVSYLEIGAINKNVHYDFKKALTIALPRRDQIIRQLSRIGLKATQLGTEDLIKLFYDIYNPTQLLPETQAAEQKPQPVQPTAPQTTPDAEIFKTETAINQNQPSPLPLPPTSTPTPQPAPTQPVIQTRQAGSMVDSNRPASPYPPQAQSGRPAQTFAPRRKPYVVEELKEEYAPA